MEEKDKRKLEMNFGEVLKSSAFGKYGFSDDEIWICWRQTTISRFYHEFFGDFGLKMRENRDSLGFFLE